MYYSVFNRWYPFREVYMASIEIQFPIGTPIYRIYGNVRLDSVKISCKVCKGKPTQQFDGGTWQCDACSGKGFDEKYTAFPVISSDANSYLWPGYVYRNRICIEESKGVIYEIVEYKRDHLEDNGFAVHSFQTTDGNFGHENGRIFFKDIKFQAIHTTEESALKELKRVQKLIEGISEPV